MSEIGDNSKELLKSLAERIESRSREKQEAADDIRELYAEAKSSGLNVSALRQTIRLKLRTAEQKQKAEETAAIADTYALALGMIAS